MNDWYEAERLCRAAQDGDVAEIERLIASGYELDKFDEIGRTPLHYAVAHGHYEAVYALLGHHAWVDANDDATIGDTPLALAAQGELLDMVRLLLAAGADPDTSGWMGYTARSRACGRRDPVGIEMCKLLSEYAPSST